MEPKAGDKNWTPASVRGARGLWDRGFLFVCLLGWVLVIGSCYVVVLVNKMKMYYKGVSVVLHDTI